MIPHFYNYVEEMPARFSHTVPEMAKRLNVSHNWLRNKTKGINFPYASVKKGIGSRLYFDPDEVEAHLNRTKAQ